MNMKLIYDSTCAFFCHFFYFHFCAAQSIKNTTTDDIHIILHQLLKWLQDLQKYLHSVYAYFDVRLHYLLAQNVHKMTTWTVLYKLIRIF